MNRRVAITGVGCICGLGNDLPAVWAEAAAGRSAIRPIENVDQARLIAKNAAEVRGFDPETRFDPKLLGALDRVSQFASSPFNETGTLYLLCTTFISSSIILLFS